MNWEDAYIRSKPAELPWNAEAPDPDLVRLVTEGRIPKGQALDIGTGTGHDAVYLIEHGFDVIAIDISPTAIHLARENASNHGLFAFFQLGDVRDIPVEDKFVDFANDRGCFHLLDEADFKKAAAEIARVMRWRGLFLLRVFEERKDLQSYFDTTFNVLEAWSGHFAGPAKRASYSMLMERK
jgi:ubiquinone/menaquinone biosynthesis C-methylase UbiE